MPGKQLYLRWSENERRSAPRAGLEDEAVFHCAGRDYILTARDVSETGLGAEPAAGVTAQTEGSVEFHLAPAELPIACRCRVVYALDGEGIGIEFLDLSDDVRSALRYFARKSN
ncbi:MAG: PilZ domain-containing protein [Terriglobia bacterium]